MLGSRHLSNRMAGLSVDLDISRVNVAALKARRGEPASDSEKEAAANLAAYYRRILDMQRGRPLPSAQSVPLQGLREGLEHAMAAVPLLSAPLAAYDPQILGRVVRCLNELANARVSPEAAEELVRGLSQLSKQPLSPRWSATGPTEIIDPDPA